MLRRSPSNGYRGALALVASISLSASAPASQWTSAEGPTVGPIDCIAVSPTEPDRLVVAVRTRVLTHLFHQETTLAWSDDGAASWTEGWSSEFPYLLDIEPHPYRPGLLWGADHSADVSIDGGRTWSVVHSVTNPVEAIAVDRTDPDRVYGVGMPVYADGELHRTLDGGRTWTELLHFALIPFDVAVVHDLTPGAVLIAGSGGIHRSTDLGETFTTVLGGVTGTKLAVAAANPSVVWCSTFDATGTTALHRSLDGGRTWAATTSPTADPTTVAAHATNADIAFVATVSSGAYTTFDGGLTWIRGTGLPDTAHLHSIVVDPQDPTTLYGAGRGSRGGVFESQDSGLHWRSANRGLASTIPELSFDERGRAYAVGLGVPVRRSADEAIWHVLDHPSGSTTWVSDLTIDPRSPRTIAWIDDVPSWWEPNEVWLSSDDGRTWEDATPPASHHEAAYEARVIQFDGEGTLYAMSRFGRLYRRASGDSFWYTLPAPWGSPGDLVPDPHDPTVLHATDDGTYYRSLDSGRNWSSSGTGLSGAYSLDELTVDPIDTNVLFVLAFADSTTMRAYRSIDRGTTWTPIGAGLPHQGLACLALDLIVPGRLLVGTLHDGVFLSVDDGTSFVPWNEGLPDVPVYSIAFDPTRPTVAWTSTAGGGLWERPLP